MTLNINLSREITGIKGEVDLPVMNGTSPAGNVVVIASIIEPVAELRLSLGVAALSLIAGWWLCWGEAYKVLVVFGWG